MFAGNVISGYNTNSSLTESIFLWRGGTFWIQTVLVHTCLGYDYCVSTCAILVPFIVFCVFVYITYEIFPLPIHSAF